MNIMHLELKICPLHPTLLYQWTPQPNPQTEPATFKDWYLIHEFCGSGVAPRSESENQPGSKRPFLHSRLSSSDPAENHQRTNRV